MRFNVTVIDPDESAKADQDHTYSPRERIVMHLEASSERSAIAKLQNMKRSGKLDRSAMIVPCDA